MACCERRITIILSNQARHCIVVGKLDYRVGSVNVHAVMGVKEVEERAKDTALGDSCVDPESV